MKRLLSLVLALMLAMAAMVVPAMAEDAKQVIITSIADDPEVMNPTECSFARSSRVLQNLFTGLYKMDSNGETYIPSLAESYEMSEDGLTYTFTLKDGLKWSDGSDLTAYDFEYSWLTTLYPVSNASNDLWVIKNGEAYSKEEVSAEEVGVKALDEKTFQVELEATTPWFIKIGRASCRERV